MNPSAIVFRTPAQPATRTLVVGSLSRAEERVLSRLGPTARNWRRAESLGDAVCLLREQAFDRILLFQARPGELPRDTPEVILNLRPEAKLLSVAGAWCEGELRTGKPWDGVRRVYWHELSGEVDEGNPLAVPQVALVNTRSYESASAWVDTLAELEYGALWQRRCQPEPLAAGVAIGVWDGDQIDGLEADHLAEFCHRMRKRGARVVAVFDYPRADVVETALGVGASVVLGRPWTLDALSAALAQVRSAGTLALEAGALTLESSGAEQAGQHRKQARSDGPADKQQAA